jgi:hypothetical protein
MRVVLVNAIPAARAVIALSAVIPTARAVEAELPVKEFELQRLAIFRVVIGILKRVAVGIIPEEDAFTVTV